VQRAARKLFLTSLIALLAVIGFAATPAQAATWSTSAQYGSWSNGGYTLYNDVWGSGAGAQTMWANSYSNWGVWANHPNTGGVKSYPNATKYVGKTLTSLSSVTSSFNVTAPSSGSYETAYDIWDSNNANEIMLWMNYTGAVGPLGSSVGTVTVGGHTWTLYKGSNGSNAVYSFVRTSNTSSGSVNILAVMNYLKNTMGYFGDITLGNVQFGFEITSSSGGLNFTTNSFGVSSS
jgi:hypothetical protein